MATHHPPDLRSAGYRLYVSLLVFWVGLRWMRVRRSLGLMMDLGSLDKGVDRLMRWLGYSLHLTLMASRLAPGIEYRLLHFHSR